MPVTRGDISSLAEAALEILQRIGVRVVEGRAADGLAAAGGQRRGDIVRIPREVVARALASAPRRFRLCDATGRASINLDRRHVYFGTGSDTPNVRDPGSGNRRPARLDDVARAARLSDRLGAIDFVMSMGLAGDVPPRQADRSHFEAMAANTVKPIVFTATSDGALQEVIASAEAAAGGVEQLRARPRAALYAMPISPLVHPPEVTPMIRTAAEFGVPLIYASGVIAGATGPATLAGSVAVGAAECLAGLVLHQLARPGAPFVFGVIGSVMDMRTAVSAYGGAEFWMLNELATRLGHHLGLPVFGAGGCADAKTLDEQAALEMAMSLASAHAAGTDLVHDVGYLESGQTACLEGIVLADEIIRHLRHSRRGIRVDPERLGTEAIERVGPGGHYLDDPHTLSHYRDEFLLATRLDRQRFESWISSGARTLGQRLSAEVNSILAEG